MELNIQAFSTAVLQNLGDVGCFHETVSRDDHDETVRKPFDCYSLMSLHPWRILGANSEDDIAFVENAIVFQIVH